MTIIWICAGRRVRHKEITVSLGTRPCARLNISARKSEGRLGPISRPLQSLSSCCSGVSAYLSVRIFFIDSYFCPLTRVLSLYCRSWWMSWVRYLPTKLNLASSSVTLCAKNKSSNCLNLVGRVCKNSRTVSVWCLRRLRGCRIEDASRFLALGYVVEC